MANRHSFSKLRQAMSPERQAANAAATKQMISELPLHELRRARELTQQHIAEMLHVDQAAVSKLERRTDMYVQSLRRFIEAMGGELVVTAKFAEGEVKISNFDTPSAAVIASRQAARV
jgi:transcriptional regulator with XRE-family HTH domain